MPKWPEILLLFFSFTSYLSRLLFNALRLGNSDAAAYKSVSPFYGPGVYLGWYLVAANTLLQGPDSAEDHQQGVPPEEHDNSNESEGHENGKGAEGHDTGHPANPYNGTSQPPGHVEGEARWKIKGDLLGIFYYVAAASTCCVVRIFLSHNAELEAGLVVLEAAADMSIIQVFTSTTAVYCRIAAIVLVIFSFWAHSVPWASLIQYQAPAIPTALMVLLGSMIWFLHTLDLKPLSFTVSQRRVIILIFLVGEWGASGGLGTYRVMPRTGDDMISLDQLLVLDQLASLGLALVTIIWSWVPQVSQASASLRERVLKMIKRDENL